MLQQKYRVAHMKTLVADDHDDADDSLQEEDTLEFADSLGEDASESFPDALSEVSEEEQEELNANHSFGEPVSFAAVASEAGSELEWSGALRGLVANHPTLEFVKQKTWAKNACCAGKSSEIYKVTKLRRTRAGRLWYGGEEDLCAEKAVEQGFTAFMIIKKGGACMGVKSYKCFLETDTEKCGGVVAEAGYSIRDITKPRVDSVYPHGGPFKGGQVVTVNGINLWPGPNKKNDMQEFTPPVTVCLNNIPCEIDYFNSTSKKVLCRTRTFKHDDDDDDDKKHKDNLTDKSLENSLTLSENLCNQIEKQVPGGYVFKQDEFVRTGVGWCDSRIAQFVTMSTEACKKKTLELGGKAFTSRANKWKGRQLCNIYGDYCNKPRPSHAIYHVYSLIPPLPGVYIKHHGEFVGGLVNQKWNIDSECHSDPFECGYAYSDHMAAKVVDVVPSIATPGDKITVVGYFWLKDVLPEGKVWLVSEDSPDDPVFCKIMDESGKMFKITHIPSHPTVAGQSYFDCMLPVGLAPGKYDVMVYHEHFGESLPFESISVLAKIDTVQRENDILTLTGMHLDQIKTIDISGTPCSVQDSEFGMATCKLSKKAGYWNSEYYPGGAGAVVEKVSLGDEPGEDEEIPKTFPDALIEARSSGIEPEFSLATSLVPPRAVESGESTVIHYTRVKAFLKVPKSGVYIIVLYDHNGWGYSTFSLSGLKKAEGARHKHPTGQFTFTSYRRKKVGFAELEAGKLYPVQLETSHRHPHTKAAVDLWLEPESNRSQKILFDASTLVRLYDEPQVMGPNVMCANALGCALPKASLPSALLQAEVRVRPAAPERARRTLPKEMTMQQLAGLRQSAPGLGQVRRPALLQAPVPGSTTTTEDGRTCHWGPETLHGTLEGCVLGDDCKKYSNLKEAQTACSSYKGDECGGIVKMSYRKKGYVYEIRKGRWLGSDLKATAYPKLACGYWKKRADDVGRDSDHRACNLKDFQVEGEFGKTVDECKNFCMQSSPRRPSGLISTRFIEYHNDSYCACFSDCEYSRHPDAFMATADVYEMVSADINTTEEIPYLERYKNNPCLNKVCTYSKKSTWGDSGVPSGKDTDIIYIPENVTLLLDQDVDIRYWVVEGTLIMAEKDIHMKAEGILVNGGKMQAGAPDKPFKNKLTFEMFGHWHSYRIPVFGSKVIGLTTGNLELYGKPIKKTWVELAETAMPKATTLKVMGLEAAEWEAGSKIVVAATDRQELDCDSDRKDLCQTEELTLVSTKAEAKTTILTVKEALKYRHLVEEMTGKRGEDMSIRAEVGLLSRNIRVIGSQDVDGTQHFGAQVMMLKPDKVALEYAEFTHVGQAHSLGRYPVHFHHSGNLKARAHVRGCAIHRTFNRAVTNHGTHNLLVENNVAYNVQGMAFFFEDAVEEGAIYRNNLGVLVRQSFSLLQKDMTPAVFWVTNPNNHLYNNHAAGGHGFGFWYDIHLGPRGLSLGMQGYHPSGNALGTFVNNTAHSCGRGLWITNYDPAEDGNRIPAVFEGTKTWGNGEGYEGLNVGHIWLKRHVSISDGDAAVATAIYTADVWGSKHNKWNAPMLMDVTIKSMSGLPRELWSECGFHGPTGDYVTSIGMHVHDRFKKGFFCGCKWCPTPNTGGLEIRFMETTFLNKGARSIRKGWRSNFDSYLHDADGTMSGEGRCHLHGCQVHPPIDGGLGHFPPDECKMRDVGIVCTANVALRTMRMRSSQPATLKFKKVRISTPYGTSGSSFYFYDFRRNRQGGGLHHYTMVSGVTHSISWNMGGLDVDVDNFYGEICGLRKDEYFLWGTKTIANPVSFSFNGKTGSLEKWALIGCPDECKKASCIDYLVDGECTMHKDEDHKYTFCGGCRVKPNENSNHRLLKIGVECKARDLPLGEHTTVDDCAAACAKKESCKYFIFGHGTKKGRCYQESTESEKCPEGFQADMYDFYAVREPKGGKNDTLAGVDFEALNKQERSNGLWQYTDAIESFDVDKWKAGSFTGLLNTKIAGEFKTSRWGPFDGSEERPASNWVYTDMQPCLRVNFKRLEGEISQCADKKDHDRYGMHVPPKTLSWCSDEWDKDDVKKWTIKSMWETNDTIVIPGTWKVHFNCKKPIKVKVLEIHGEVIFEDGADRSLQATHIYISYMGALRIGTAEKPFESKALLALEGNRRTPHWPAGELGSKFIASNGKLDLYGQAKPTWTKLAKSVKKGADTVETKTDLKLKAGDEVLVTTTDLSAANVEHRTVKSVDGTKVTFTKALDAAHDGLDATHDGFKDTLGMMAGEVAVLRGNIKIVGLEGKALKNRSAIKDEGWGVNIKVFTISAGCDAPAELHMQGVEIVDCGRDNDECIKADDVSIGSINNTVVRNGLGNGFTGGFGAITTGEKIVLTANVVYNVPQGWGIKSKGATTFNLVTKCGYGYRSVTGALDFTDNVAAGISNYREFHKPKDVCGFVDAIAPGQWKAVRNTFRSCGNGIIIGQAGKSIRDKGKGQVCARTIPSQSAYPATTTCGAIEDMVVIHCNLMGMHAYQGSLIVNNMTFINAFKAVSIAGTGPEAHDTAENSMEVRNSKIYAKQKRCGGSGIAAGVWYEGWLREHKPLTAVTLYGGTVVESVTFYGFGDCSPALVNDVGSWSMDLHDGAHGSMFTKDLKFVGGAKTALVEMYNSGKGCVQMACDGRRSSIIADTDGTLIGKPGTVVARNEQAWDYKLLPHSMRFDPDGKKIPEEKLYSGKGAYRKGCKLEQKWNAWVCPGGKHRILILESLDPDWLERRYAPVAVDVNDKNEPMGGNIGIYTGPGFVLNNPGGASGDPTSMIQAFWTIAHIGMRHNIYFSSTNPIHTRVHLRDATPDQAVVLNVYYGLPNRVEVFIGKKRAHALKEPTWDKRDMPVLDPSLPHGANVYNRIGMGTDKDKRPGYLHVVVKGPKPVDLIVSKKIKLTQKLEVGEQEFVYKKGSQGLVRNLALLLNIPESRIKVVGLGSMKDGEIWGKHNGVNDGYKPPSLLQAEKPELMQVVIDPHEAENEDEVDGEDPELLSVFKQAKYNCKQGDIKCLKPPEIDAIPIPGWSCEADKFGTGDGCDCDCGIWDPDCDEDAKFGYGVLEAKDKINLLDTSRVEALLKKFDTSPKNHELDTAELYKINETLVAVDPLRKLAHQIQLAAETYIPLLKLSKSDTCEEGKKCMMNPKAVLTEKALPSGVCTAEPEAKKGSACDSKPCGDCSTCKCISSEENSFGYTCVPASTYKKVAIMSKVTGKFLTFVQKCVGRGRRRRCHWALEQANDKITSGDFVEAGIGVYASEPLKKFREVKTAEECIALGKAEGAKAVGRRNMWHRKVKQPCWIFKDLSTGRRIGGRAWRTYEASGKSQAFELKVNTANQFQISGTDSCLSLTTGQLRGEKCADYDKTQFFEISQTCKEVGTIKVGSSCIEVSSKDNLVKMASCIPNYANQQLTLVKLD